MSKTKEQLRTEAIAKRDKIRAAYIDLVVAISDAPALKLLKPKEVQMLIGKNADGFSTTLIQNMQRRRLEQIYRENLQSTADWIKSLIISTYPQADVDIEREEIIKVYLKGKPKDIK